MNVIPLSDDYGLDVLFQQILSTHDKNNNAIVIIIDEDGVTHIHSKCSPMEMAYAAMLLSYKSAKDH